MENLELLSFDELREKISKMEEVLKILNSDADIATKNYLLIERILSKNNIEIERKYDSETDVLELKINCSDIKMCSKAIISNYISLEDTEMTILINLYRALKDISVLLKTTKYEMVIDVDKRNNFKKIFNDIDEILLPNHDEIASNIAIYILNDIFGNVDPIHFFNSNDLYHFITFSKKYCGLKYGINASIYDLISVSPYSILKFILKKVIIKKCIILSKALCKKIHVKYFETNGITLLIEDRDIIKLYNKNNNVLATITLDDNEYKRVCVLFMDSFPKTYEFLDAISLFMKGIEYEFNKYLKDVE